MEGIAIQRRFHEAISIIDQFSRCVTCFRFLELPFELRYMIYDHVYGPDFNNVLPLIEINVNHLEPPRQREERVGFAEPNLAIEMHVDRGLINLQLASKQIYKEANSFYYKHLLVKVDLMADYPKDQEDLSFGLWTLQERFRKSLRRISTDCSTPNFQTFFPRLKGIIHRWCSFDAQVTSPEQLLLDFVDKDPRCRSCMDKLTTARSKTDGQGIDCWFRIKHISFKAQSNSEKSYTWIHYNSQTKKLTLGKQPETVDKSAAIRNGPAGDYVIANFPTFEVGPYRHAPFDPPMAYYCPVSGLFICPCQYHLLQMSLKLNVRVVPPETERGRSRLEQIPPEELRN